tara:strand:+ start:209 stop:655 length:447 start_codon:yes stop_codon:yes gene_type:complete
MENNIFIDISNNVNFIIKEKQTNEDEINNEIDEINNEIDEINKKINKNLEKVEQEHIDMNIGKYTKNIYCYDKSKNLPSNGWLQKCFPCNKITSSTMLVKKTENVYMKHNYYFYICSSCKNDIDQSEKYSKLFYRECNIYIKEKYTFY